MQFLQMDFIIFILVLNFSNVLSETWHLYNHTEYYVQDTPKTFDDAKLSCEKMQAVLVMTKTEEVHAFVTQLIYDFYPSGNYNILYLIISYYI